MSASSAPAARLNRVPASWRMLMSVFSDTTVWPPLDSALGWLITGVLETVTEAASMFRATNNVARGGDASNGSAGGGSGGAFFAEGRPDLPTSLTVMDGAISRNLARGGDGIDQRVERFVARWLGWLLPDEEREFVLGDLEEARSLFAAAIDLCRDEPGYAEVREQARLRLDESAGEGAQP